MTNIILTTNTEVATKKVFTSEKLTQYTKEIENYIEEVQNKATANHLLIAQTLGTIATENLYAEDGFKSCAEYAMQTFGWKKANAYAMVQVGIKFNKGELPEGAFSVSQYREMLTCDSSALDDAIESGEINEGMSAKEIRDVVKTLKPAKERKAKAEPIYTWLMDGVIESHVLEETMPAMENLDWVDWTQKVHIKKENVDIIGYLVAYDGEIRFYTRGAEVKMD